MTREEAKAILENDIVDGHVEGNARFMDAFWMAVDALSQEPYICDSCKHKDDSWDTEPCDGCCGNHSGYEPQEGGGEE